MVADGQADTKTRERTEGATTAIQAMHGDSCSANRVDPDSMCSTSFGDDCTKPPALPCSSEDTLVDNGAAAPKSCLPPLEMCSPTAADGLLPTGEASVATKTTFNPPPLRLYSTEETNSKKTSTQSVSYDSSFFWKNNLPVAPSCRRVIETKSGQNSIFDPGSSRSFPRLPVFWERGTRCFVGRLYVLERLVAICSAFSGWKEVREISFSGARYKQSDRCFSTAAILKRSCRQERLKAIGAEGANGGRAVDGSSRL